MDKDNTKKLSPFSALKYSSPPRNLVVKLDRIKVESLPPPPEAEKSKKTSKPGPMTRSRTGVVSKPVKRYVENESNEEEEIKEIKNERKEKVYTNKKYNPRNSKIVTGPRRDQPSTSRGPQTTSVKDNFRFDLKESPKRDSRDVDRHDSHRDTFSRRESHVNQTHDSRSNRNYRNDSWQNARGRNIFPQRGLPSRYNLDIFNPAVPPPAPPPKPTSVFNIPRPVSNYSFNIPLTDDFREEVLQSTEVPKPSAASVFKFELPSVFPQASGSDVTEGLEEKRKKSQKLVNDYLKSVGFTEEVGPAGQSKKANLDNLMEVDEDSKITIDRAEAILGQVLRKLDVMSRRRRFMEKNVDLIPNYEWQMKSQQYDIDRREIVEMLEPLLSSTAIEALQQRLKKRRAKMAWAHERNKVYRSRKQMEKERRVRTRAFVDYWHEKWEALEREGRDKEEEKKLAQRLLPDVNKRIAETKEFIQIFGRLKQLSVARLVADGQNVEGQVEEFNKNMDELQAVWDDLLMEYQEEKIMLDTLIDRRTSHAPLPPEPQSIEQQWLEMLFGRESIYDEQNPYLIAERDIINLVRIRGAWDQHLVPKDAAPGVGSSIPIFWVLPSTTPMIAWRKYRRQN